MKIIKLHSRTTSIVYKNSLCSLAFIVVFLISVLTVVIPILLITWIAPNSGISQNKVIFEQPDVRFQHKFIFIGSSGDGGTIACSTFPYFNMITSEYQRCKGIKYWENDFNYDRRLDKANFEIETDFGDNNYVQNVHIVLFFEAILKHGCTLSPPAVIIQEIEIPTRLLPGGLIITINGRLKFTQTMQFTCPFFGRRTKSHFFNEILQTNTTQANSFKIEKIRQTIRDNMAFFEIEEIETYFEKRSREGLQIKFGMEIYEVSVRYHLSVWERLGQFWIYFISFFVITHYVAGKVKNILFSRHILRSWEIIPWKKLY